MSDDLPTQLGRYRVLRRLGTGGMAEVFLAKSAGAEGIEKILVVKRVLPSFARSSKFITMFVDEAKVAMRLNHPNIVQVYAFEQVKREFLLAMEFCDGLDLGRLVAAARRMTTRIPYGLCAYLVLEVARGLDYAHKRKDEAGVPMDIVHRDVSPQNVLLTYDGVVKVGDFGIAKARMVSEETGVIKGKFAYMSPEQARGERVDQRSDVYSLGILLAELLMNRPMYPGQHGLDVLEKVREGELTLPREVDPEVPRPLERIVRRATANDREERYQSARSMAGALTQFLHIQEQVWDGEALEHFIQEVAPRSETSPEALKRPIQTFTGGATVMSGMAIREVRERRRVVVVAGRIRSAASGDGEHRVDQETAKVLADIAYKADAVLSWPDGLGRNRFRFIVGLGKASVNDPLKATRLATDTLDALEGLSADKLQPMSASMGLSRGMVSTVRDPGGRLLRYAPVGDVLEVAEKMADAGSATELLVAGEVYRLVRRDYAFDPAEREVDVQTNATDDPRMIRAWRLRGARTQEERAEDVRSTVDDLFGRDEELETLQRLYEEARETKKIQFAAVEGELGVGKTSLVSGAVRTFPGDPHIFRVECAFGSADVPFAAVLQMIRVVASIGDDATGEEALAILDKRLAVGLSKAERRLLRRAIRPLFGLEAERNEGDRTDMVRKVVGALVRIAALERPVVVWIDALQWADGPSLQLLGQLRQQTYEIPCLVLMVTRPHSRLDAVFRGVPRIELRELGESARGQLIQACFDAEVPTEIHQLIENRAGGNPFFIVELVEALEERDAVRVELKHGERRVVRRPEVPIHLPTTLEGVIAARLDELDDRERKALRWLAVAGAGMRTEDVSFLAGTNLAEALQRLVERHIIQQRSSGTYEFPNAVVRQVAYEATDLEDRVRMHRRIAQHLASASASPGRIARHLEQAGERAAAAKAYLDAANSARDVYSNREALRFFGRALMLLAPDDLADRFRAHEGREQILRFLGRRDEQLRELEGMRAIAERGGSPRRRAVALLHRARFDLDNAQAREADELVPQALEAARAAGDIKLELDALRVEAELARDRGQPDRGLKACETALERAGYARELLSQRGSVLVQKGILLRRMGRSDEAYAAYAEAIVIFRRLGIRRSEAFALNSLGVALAAGGAYEDAIVAFRASIHIDRETGDRLRLGRKLSNVGQLYDALGDGKRGISFIQRALDVFEAVDDRAGRCDALAAIAEVMLDEGSTPSAARVPLDQARRIAERLGTNYELARERIVRAQLERAAKRPELAEQAARRALQAARGDGLVGYEVHALAHLAAALVDRNSPDEATDCASQARTKLQEVDVERTEKAHLALARVFARLGLHEESDALYRDARNILDEKAASIRSSVIRQRYLESTEAQAIRSEGPPL
ncbi:MAG: protein kinase [Myxococcota bacterium]